MLTLLQVNAEGRVTPDQRHVFQELYGSSTVPVSISLSVPFLVIYKADLVFDSLLSVRSRLNTDLQLTMRGSIYVL